MRIIRSKITPRIIYETGTLTCRSGISKTDSGIESNSNEPTKSKMKEVFVSPTNLTLLTISSWSGTK